MELSTLHTQVSPRHLRKPPSTLSLGDPLQMGWRMGWKEITTNIYLAVGLDT